MKTIASLPALFALSLLAAVPATAATVLSDTFTYADGPLTTATGSPWVTHSGTAGQVDVTSGAITITSAESEDVNAPLNGGPYTVGTVSATFSFLFTSLPTATGSYFTHFKDDANGFRARVVASTTGATAGGFFLGISNAGSTLAATVNVPTELALNTLHTLTVTLDIATSSSMLSIDGGTPVAAADTTNNTPISVGSYAFRQAAGIGTSTIDNLTVTYVPEPAPVLLGALGLLGILRRRR